MRAREDLPYYLLECTISYRTDELDQLFGPYSVFELSNGSGGYEKGSNENGSGGRPCFDTGEKWEDMEEHSYGYPAERSALL